MPSVNGKNAGVVARFAYQQLMGSPEWVALHGERLYEDVMVGGKRQEPFGVVEARLLSSLTFPGAPSEYIGKQTSRLKVVSVKTYQLGDGTWFESDAIVEILRVALTGIVGLSVLDAGGNKIGEIDDSAFLDEVKMARSQGNFDVLHRGIVVKVTHR